LVPTGVRLGVEESVKNSVLGTQTRKAGKEAKKVWGVLKRKKLVKRDRGKPKNKEKEKKPEKKPQRWNAKKKKKGGRVGLLTGVRGKHSVEGLLKSRVRQGAPEKASTKKEKSFGFKIKEE